MIDPTDHRSVSDLLDDKPDEDDQERSARLHEDLDRLRAKMDDKKATGEQLREAVFMAIGAASMCWEHPGRAGVFDSDRARQVGESLLDSIRDLTPNSH